MKEVASHDGGDQRSQGQDGVPRLWREDTAGKDRGGRGSGDPGQNTIADGVVEKIAGMAAREVPGVHALGSGFARTMSTVRDMVPGGRAGVTRGVKIEVGEIQTAIDLAVVVEYGVAIADLAADVRENVITGVERMTGLEVGEVNIAVNDVHLPDEDEEETTTEGRVQ
ncbi:Asp23/Gls24 family envelope stress response protein [Streptomyces sp. NPDC058644]|uniref:Asp23/Gls24 family envelope stress response protein n=1 Tax=unclassified Streptomyces TaxID=2593676 RepID=UPI00365D3E02